MRRLAVVLLLGSCVTKRDVQVNFGEDGEGLDGFLCKAPDAGMLLDRVGDAGYASLVTDFIGLEGLPGCRTGQLVKWCSEHHCKPISGTQLCIPITLPSGISDREAARDAVQQHLASLKDQQVIADAPNEPTILRVLATTQSCDEVKSGVFDTAKLVGCAYSCPTEFDRQDQPVYLGFETLTGTCEQGVRICADGELHWKP